MFGKVMLMVSTSLDKEDNMDELCASFDEEYAQAEIELEEALEAGDEYAIMQCRAAMETLIEHHKEH